MGLVLAGVHYQRLLVGIVVLGAALRFLGLDWDHGRGLHPDENNLVVAALTLGVDGRLIPEFHAYNDLALWVPRLVSLPFCAVDDRACLALTARAVSATLSVLVIPLAAAVAGRLAGGGARVPAGLGAALVIAVSPPLVQWAHFGTTESAIGLLVLLAWWVAMRWQDGAMTDRTMAIVSGVALGVGFGFKTTALAVAVIPLAAVALAGWPDRDRWRLLLVFALVTPLQALAFAPSVVFDTGPWLDVMAFENGVVQGTVPVFWTAQFHGATSGLFELRQIWSLTAGAGLLLAALGVALLPRRHWRLAAPGLAFALVYAALTFGWHAKFVRYLAPLIPVLLVFAGVGLGRIVVQMRSRTAAAAGLAGLGLMVMAGIDHASSYLRPDPRVAMERQLLALSLPGDRVAIEPRDLAQIGGLPGLALPVMEAGVTAHALADPLAAAEWLVIASRRNWSVLPRQPGAPPVLCAYYAGLASGALGYVPVRRTDRAGVFGRLFDPGLEAEETRRVFDRPEVFLFRNIAHLPADTIAEALNADLPSESCAPAQWQRTWKAGP